MTDNIDAALADLDLMDMDQFAEDGAPNTSLNSKNSLNFFQEVPLKVTLEVASADVTLGELSRVQDGDVLPLDKMVGEPLDVMVNGMLFAKGLVVMVEGRYGIKFVRQNESHQAADKDDE